MNKNFIQKKNYLEKNIGKVLYSLEDRTNKITLKNYLIKENVIQMNKYEKNLFQIKKTFNEKFKERNLLKDILNQKRNGRLDIKQTIMKYLEFLKIKNHELISQLILYYEEEMLINYKNKIINQLLKSNEKKLNPYKSKNDVSIISQKSNREIYLDKNDSIKSISSMSIKSNGNNQYFKPKEIKIENSNNSKKYNDKKKYKWKVNNSFNQIKNKQIIIFNDDTPIKQLNRTIINKSNINNSIISKEEIDFENINDYYINNKYGKKLNSKRKIHSQENRIFNNYNNYKVKSELSNGINYFQNDNINIKNSKRKYSNGSSYLKENESKNNLTSLNHSNDYYIEARENLKKMLFKEYKIKNNKLNESFLAKNNNKKLNLNNKDEIYHKSTIQNKSSNKMIFKEIKSDNIRQFFFQNALIDSMKYKYFNDNDKNKKESYDNLLKVIFLKLELYQNKIKKSVFKIIKNYKINFYYFIKKCLKKYKISKRLCNLLIIISNKYNEIKKYNEFEIIHDNEFLNQLNFFNKEKYYNIIEYKDSLSKIKKITQETKEIEKKILKFSKNI